MKSRKLNVKFPVFGDYTVYIEMTDDMKKSLAKRKVTAPAISEIDNNAHAMVIHDDNASSYVFLPMKPAVGTIAHEAWHVIKGMMEYAGVELDNETVAYHLGYLVNKISKFVRKA